MRQYTVYTLVAARSECFYSCRAYTSQDLMADESAPAMSDELNPITRQRRHEEGMYGGRHRGFFRSLWGHRHRRGRGHEHGHGFEHGYGHGFGHGYGHEHGHGHGHGFGHGRGYGHGHDHGFGHGQGPPGHGYPGPPGGHGFNFDSLPDDYSEGRSATQSKK